MGELPHGPQTAERTPLVPLAAERYGEVAGRISLARGEILFRQGDETDYVYLVERGRIETYREREDGTEETRARFGPGEYFGDRQPLGTLARTISARATETTVLARYRLQAFRAWRAPTFGGGG